MVAAEPSVVLRYPESEDACRTSCPSTQPPGAIEPSGSGWNQDPRRQRRRLVGDGLSHSGGRTMTTMLRSIASQVALQFCCVFRGKTA